MGFYQTRETKRTVFARAFRIAKQNGMGDDAARDAANLRASEWEARKLAEKAADMAKRADSEMTCQVCGRGILSSKGILAHHGYERPGTGWQTGSCMGARIVPYEVSRDTLGVYIRALESRLESLAESRVKVESESVDLSHNWKVRLNPGQWPAREETRGVHFNRAGFDAAMAGNPDGFRRGDTFDKFKAAALREIESNRVLVESYRREAQRRFDAWPGPTHTFKGGKWNRI